MRSYEPIGAPCARVEGDLDVAAAALPGSAPGLLVDPAVPLVLGVLAGLEPMPDSEGLSLRTELEAARAVQQSLLPKAFPELKGYELAGFCRSARHVSGDFYDVVSLDPGTVLLVVADVMGKGVPAALFAATLRTLVRTMTEWTQRPADMLARINALTCDELSNAGMFITAQLAVVDTKNRQLRVASAGHHPLLLANALGQVQAVSPQGLPLGIAENASFSESCVSLEPSAHALLYTDGLTDARNLRGDSFGSPGLTKWLSQNSACGLSAAQLKERFLAEMAEFSSNLAINDDQTFLLLAPTVSSAREIVELDQAALAG